MSWQIKEKTISKVGVDQEACMGCGTCVALLGEMIEMDESKGVARVKSNFPPNISADKILEVVNACPSGAIKLYDENGQVVDLS